MKNIVVIEFVCVLAKEGLVKQKEPSAYKE